MKFALPTNDAHLMTRVTARTGTAPGDWSYATTVDSSFASVDISLPTGVEEADVEAFAEFLTPAGEVTGATVLKTKERKPVKSAAPVTPVTAAPSETATPNTATIEYMVKDGLLDSVHEVPPTESAEQPVETKTETATETETKAQETAEANHPIGHVELHKTKADEAHHA